MKTSHQAWQESVSRLEALEKQVGIPVNIAKALGNDDTDEKYRSMVFQYPDIEFRKTLIEAQRNSVDLYVQYLKDKELELRSKVDGASKSVFTSNLAICIALALVLVLAGNAMAQITGAILGATFAIIFAVSSTVQCIAKAEKMAIRAQDALDENNREIVMARNNLFLNQEARSGLPRHQTPSDPI